MKEEQNSWLGRSGKMSVWKGLTGNERSEFILKNTTVFPPLIAGNHSPVVIHL